MVSHESSVVTEGYVVVQHVRDVVYLHPVVASYEVHLPVKRDGCFVLIEHKDHGEFWPIVSTVLNIGLDSMSEDRYKVNGLVLPQVRHLDDYASHGPNSVNVVDLQSFPLASSTRTLL